MSASAALKPNLHNAVSHDHWHRVGDSGDLGPPFGLLVDDPLLERYPLLDEVPLRPIRGASVANGVQDYGGHSPLYQHEIIVDSTTIRRYAIKCKISLGSRPVSKKYFQRPLVLNLPAAGLPARRQAGLSKEAAAMVPFGCAQDRLSTHHVRPEQTDPLPRVHSVHGYGFLVGIIDAAAHNRGYKIQGGAPWLSR